MRKRIFSLVTVMSVAVTMVSAQETSSTSSPKVTPEHRARAAALVSQMTLEEKCAYIGGSEDGFYIRPVERLGIPLIRMADGPQGVRNNTKSTLFACGVAAAASWNEDIAHEMGIALGQDARARGVHILLGPGVNIYRSPLCGRNFEYMGEDPLLASRTASRYIEGLQSQGVMATVKHFALNNQEYNRHHVSSDADERTMYEIYFPAFKAAVDAGVASVMSSYNLVNNVHAAENRWLLTDVLKDEWGFDGFVMSDWTSTYSPLGCVRSGLDLEMPHGFCMTYDNLKPLLDNGVIREKDIDPKVENILATLIAFGFLDRPQLDESIPQDNPYSREVAYKLSCESAVLLKNDGALPLKPQRKKNILLMGPRADIIPCGGGCGAVDPLYSISLYEGMKDLGKNYPVSLLEGDYRSEESIKAIEAASAVVLSVGFDKESEKENSDRTFALPDGQDEMIEFAAAHNDNVIVIIYAGGAVDMSRWHDKVSAILMGWYPGQEGGLAIAHMLSGEISPSGRLPMSFELHAEDNPAYSSYYVGKPYTKRGHSNLNVTYSEGVFVGYRGYEHKGVAPLYPFGHGLSYTSFEYSDLDVSPAADGCEVSFTIKNVGKKDASEVAQVYVGEVSPCVARPAKELKGYEKVFIPAGKSTTVRIHLPSSAFAYYDVDVHDWRVNPGEFNIMVGASSADIRLNAVTTFPASNGICYHDAAELTIIGKPLPTSKPFTRIDTAQYKFANATTDRYAGYSTGLAVVFATDSKVIRAKWHTSGDNSGANMAAIGQKGLDLYILQDGKWVFAGVGTPDMDKAPYTDHDCTIVRDMPEGRKECLLYLPLFDNVESLSLGIEEGAYIESIDNPFRHRIVFQGSSITHGAAASRPGMSYPARFGRDNGLYCFNLGFSGQSRLEKEYAEYLADVEADVFVFDAFSNPSAEVIEERFDEFVRIFRAAHPDTPMVFLQTERRETRNFNTVRENYEAAKQKMAREKVQELMETDKNVYFIDSDGFLSDEHIATADGTHPTDLGFTHMLDSLTPPLLRILAKYNLH